MLKLQRFDATLTDAVVTGHHVRLARVFADRRWIVTCAYDGLVIIHDETIRQVVAVIPMHHRLNSGNWKAIISSDGDTVVALGHDGSLVATRIHRENKEVCINNSIVFSLSKSRRVKSHAKRLKI